MGILEKKMETTRIQTTTLSSNDPINAHNGAAWDTFLMRASPWRAAAGHAA